MSVYVFERKKRVNAYTRNWDRMTKNSGGARMCERERECVWDCISTCEWIDVCRKIERVREEENKGICARERTTRDSDSERREEWRQGREWVWKRERERKEENEGIYAEERTVSAEER